MITGTGVYHPSAYWANPHSAGSRSSTVPVLHCSSVDLKHQRNFIYLQRLSEMCHGQFQPIFHIAVKLKLNDDASSSQNTEVANLQHSGPSLAWRRRWK